MNDQINLPEGQVPPPSTVTAPAPTGAKGAKKPKKKERSVRRRNRDICDVFGEAAMYNAYNISHNAQDFLYYRGFPWAGHKK